MNVKYLFRIGLRAAFKITRATVSDGIPLSAEMNPPGRVPTAESKKSVFVTPGLITDTEIRSSHNSTRSDSLSASSANFVAQYAETLGIERFPTMELTITIDAPHLAGVAAAARRNRGSAACTQRITPRKLVSMFAR